jgi:hypothetical protein
MRNSEPHNRNLCHGDYAEDAICRFFEMYFEQWLLEDTVSLRAGRLNIGWEYGLDYDFFTQHLSAAYRLNVGD